MLKKIDFISESKIKQNQTKKSKKKSKQNPPLFKILINSQEKQITIKTLCNDLEIINNNSHFQYVIRSFTKFMNECADKTRKHKKKPRKNKRYSKPWYNETCETLRRKFEQLAEHV